MSPGKALEIKSIEKQVTREVKRALRESVRGPEKKCPTEQGV